MGLIKFVDLPSTKTPINATNLNNNFDVMHPVGSVLITSTNTNPSSELGGTWTLIDKEFKELKIEDETGTYFTKNETNITSFKFYAIRNKKSISCRLNVFNAVELSESDVILGTLNLEKLGITRLYYGLISNLGATDGGNGAFQFSISWETGKITSNDIIPKNDGGIIAIGSSCYMWFEIPFLSEHMLDSACDKFYWKRTA